MNQKPKHLFQSQSRQLAEAVAIIDHGQPKTHHFTEKGPIPDLHDLNATKHMTTFAPFNEKSHGEVID